MDTVLPDDAVIRSIARLRDECEAPTAADGSQRHWRWPKHHSYTLPRMGLVQTSESSWTIETLRDYLEYLERHSEDLILFRGQSEDKPLIPKLGRVRFRNALPIPEQEKNIFTAFKREAVSFMDRAPANDWDWLAVAQHHGLPTRLLDWTKNPLAALWFSVCAPCITEFPGVVWVFVPPPNEVAPPWLMHEWPFTVEQTWVFPPPHVSPRIRAQDGMFTLHHHVEGTGFAAFEAEESRHGRLYKVVISHHDFQHIRYDLDRCGVHASAMFPDLSGLAQRIEWQNTLAADEQSSA